MSNRFLISLAALLSLALPALSSASESTAFNLDYQVQWGDSPLGTATAQWRLDKDSYSFEGQVATEGTLAFFYEFSGKNSLSGEIANGTYQPRSFKSESTYDDETYIVDMSWPAGLRRPVFSVEPKPEKGKTHPLRQASLTNVADPYTAMLMALSDFEANGTCDGIYRVFDGRRRSELHLKDFGTTTIEGDKDWAYSGPAHICGSASKMIGGHQIKKNDDSDDEMDFEKVKIFIAKPDGKTFMPVRIEMNSFLGAVVVRLNMQTSTFE